MRRMLGIATVISGAVFSIFVLNLLLYSLVPAYRGALMMVVHHADDSIPVISAEGESTFDYVEPVVINTGTKEIQDDETALSPVFENSQENLKKDDRNKPEIIERTYYEDCGTGHGYWVIKYSDGSYGIE
ncbi:hypothetical protein [Butyrivibrio sp. MC2021]|uniref:hypothetical protein n=1 Tax=Butyrivibrio sp. MC2021 TaxID=1408306 RepID=UPI00047D6E01|nr:hypothetical protein [Butyrivibrio sp. MC2021]